MGGGVGGGAVGGAGEELIHGARGGGRGCCRWFGAVV